MNRRALAWVSAAVVAIVGVSWWLSAEVAAPLPVPGPIVEPVASPQSVAIPALLVPTPLPEPVDAAVDAGSAVLAEVEIEVYENGRRLVGARVELEGPGGRVGRPTDIMGFARFTLAEGPWRVTQPERRARVPRIDGGKWRDIELALERARTTPLEVRAPLTRLRIDLHTLKRVRGRVVDLRGRPVPGAAITSRRYELDADAIVGVSRGDGSFVFETEDDPVLIQAHFDRARSTLRGAGADETTLVLEPWTTLKVQVQGPFSDVPAHVRVLHRGDFAAGGRSDEPILVPVGALELLARRGANGAVFSGKASTTTTMWRDENEAQISLSLAAPLRGMVVDTSGQPMPGITVVARELDFAAQLQLADGGSPATEEIYGPSTVTDPLGEFKLPWPGLRSAVPVYMVAVTGLWRTHRLTLVGLDETAPLTVEIAPAP
ncbi:MAG: carboxypeptidase-like regulatory domain-containing protein [Archangium sp.]|nr:carboxypeptidase-like regulatory domain-containing protein [Archangium sp.]